MTVVQIQCIAHAGKCQWCTEVRPVADEDGRGERIKVWRCVFLNARHDHQSPSKVIGVRVIQQSTTRQDSGIQTEERGRNNVSGISSCHQPSSRESYLTSGHLHSKRHLSPQLDTGHGAKRHRAYSTAPKGDSKEHESRELIAKQHRPANAGQLEPVDVQNHRPAKDRATMEVESDASDATQDLEDAAAGQSSSTKSGGGAAARQEAKARATTNPRSSLTSAQTTKQRLAAYTPPSTTVVPATGSNARSRASRQLHNVVPAVAVPQMGPLHLPARPQTRALQLPARPQMGTFFQPARSEMPRARPQAQCTSGSTSSTKKLRRSPKITSSAPLRIVPRPGKGVGMSLASAGSAPPSTAGTAFDAQTQQQTSQAQSLPGYALIQSLNAHRPPFWPFPVPVVPPGQAQHRPPAMLHQRSASSSVQPASRTEATSLSQRGRSDHH